MRRESVRRRVERLFATGILLASLGCAGGVPRWDAMPRTYASPYARDGETVGLATMAAEGAVLEQALRYHRGPPGRVTWVDSVRSPATPGGPSTDMDAALRSALARSLDGLGFCLADVDDACPTAAHDRARVRVSPVYEFGDSARVVTSWQYVGLDGQASEPVGNVFLFVRDAARWRVSVMGAAGDSRSP